MSGFGIEFRAGRVARGVATHRTFDLAHDCVHDVHVNAPCWLVIRGLAHIEEAGFLQSLAGILVVRNRANFEYCCS